jgi:polysaccharide biosynthesis/export protein
MIHFKKTPFLQLPLLLLIVSCVTQKEIEYLRDIENLETYQLNSPEEKRIKANDELYIRVSSFDDVAFNFFSNQMDARSMSMNEHSVSLISYVVDESGHIYFPIIGRINLMNLTLMEATEKLKTELSDYFNQPTVLLKFVNKKITVLGEVNQPGHYTFTENQLNIFQALGMAGDITMKGNREEISVMRDVNGNLNTVLLNSTDSQIVSSKYYYIQPGDVIYVRPLPSAKWDINSLPYNLLLSSITTFLLVLNFVSQQN